MVTKQRRLDLLHGVKFLASAPSTALKLPERLSKTPRKTAGFVVLITHAWRKWNRSMPRATSVLPAEAFVQYVSRLDELIDQAQRHDIFDVHAYRMDSAARAHVSRFVKGVKGTPLTPEQKRELFRIAGNFRRSAWKSLHEFEKQPPTLENVLRMKENTSGADARMLTAMLNVAENVPISARKQLEDAFSNLSMGCQIFDDLIDFHEDRHNRVPNIVGTVLEKYPSEYARASLRPVIRPLWLRRNCPKAYHEIQQIMGHYLSQMPSMTGSQRGIRSVPLLFWKLAQLRGS